MSNHYSHRSLINMPFKGEDLTIHRFCSTKSNYPPVLLVHGSVENGKVFFSKSGKGLAPFLESHAFDVFVADLRGRGDSKPHISRHSQASQSDTISEELPAIIDKVLEVSGAKSIHLGAHSWGGVMLMSMYALYPFRWDIKSMVFLGSKRRITVRNLNRLFYIDLGWNLIGRLITAILGYFPAKKLGVGSDDDTKKYYQQSRGWVYGKEWTDPKTDFDYGAKILTVEKPPVYNYAGIIDPILGHSQDVQLFADECGVSDSVKVLGKKNGNLRDYGHIDILTHPDAVKDHFPEIVNVYKKHS